ncbi:PREDICTED: uncharacterized protein LOC104822980 isoform X2 [Tarenaya hassleriana]|uniref:uncharacterized protein LOC104822980 isoform X2 n=1 Tax=Tarenaya hassleriana TaxID=28532 RepID=UPI00053C6614|nr:PREDICTED: uncharacterized protein LOC104822980 isoform X2 [Tarenaya hassleriana]
MMSSLPGIYNTIPTCPKLVQTNNRLFLSFFFSGFIREVIMRLMGLLGDVSVLSRRRRRRTRDRIKCCFLDHRRRKQRYHRCVQTLPKDPDKTRLRGDSPDMASGLVIRSMLFLCLFSVSLAGNSTAGDQALRPHDELRKLKLIRKHLQKINKPAVKTIQQPAFDHPQLQGQRPLDPPEMPKGHSQGDELSENFQKWSSSGESCPQGTVPVRRTTEKDMLRASSLRRFGRKFRHVRRDSTSNGHEHAVGYVTGAEYYGAKASINVWRPRVVSQYEFSLSQIWVISGSFNSDLNTIESGWQVSPELYGDTYPRFFTYWTSDAYRTTGCYNLLCSGFVQTNRRIAIGAAISPVSSYKGGQFDISLMIWKDPKHGNWWLEFGSGILVGYWPAFLFTHLRRHATMLQFGGETVNTRPGGYHTSTQMGSGHLSGEGFKRASYFRNIHVVDWDNTLVPLSNLRVLADHPNCYDIRGGVNRVWGNFFYYGGPGKNPRCP